MARGRSMAHARLMGAISRKAKSTIHLMWTLPSQPLRRVFLFSGALDEKYPGESRNGRPGSRGSRRRGACSERGACRRERGDKPDTDDRANPEGFAIAARRSERRDRIYLHLVCRVAAQPTLVVKISDTSLQGKSGFDSRLLMSRTVEAALQGPLRRGLRFLPQGKNLR